MKRRTVLQTGLIVLATFVLLAAAGWWFLLRPPFVRVGELQGRFDQIRPGMSEQAVVSLMGQPSLRDAHPIHSQPYSGQLSANVTIRGAVRYTTETFFLPVTFEVVFDEAGSVVGKHRYD